MNGRTASELRVKLLATVVNVSAEAGDYDTMGEALVELFATKVAEPSDGQRAPSQD